MMLIMSVCNIYLRAQSRLSAGWPKK